MCVLIRRMDKQTNRHKDREKDLKYDVVKIFLDSRSTGCDLITEEVCIGAATLIIILSISK